MGRQQSYEVGAIMALSVALGPLFQIGLIFSVFNKCGALVEMLGDRGSASYYTACDSV